jgi:uncharacterized membrane protein YuzA (DUF378 family)
MDFLPNTDPNMMYWNKKLYKAVMFFVIVGGVNWLVVGIAEKDLLKAFLGRKWAHWLYIVVGVCALLLAFRRDVYLPFLGQTLIPAGALSLKTPQGANESVEVRTRPGAKVIYWASEPDPNGSDKQVKSWKEAYGEYENSGVVIAAEDGKAILRIRGPPQPYKVPMKGKLAPHVHFRVEDAHGIFGSVQTVYMKTGKIEGFAGSL